MRIAFRTEGNHLQGMGDVMGSLALAAEFARDDSDLIFVVSGGEAIQAIEACHYRVAVVGSAAEELALLRAIGPDAVVVNKLSNEPDHLAAIKALTGLLVTIDDAGPGASVADLNVNPLYHLPGAVTDPAYVSLRRDFQEAHDRVREVRASVVELLVMQGGSDTHGFIPAIVRALAAAGCAWHCTVVIGPAFRHDVELGAAMAGAGGLAVTVQRNVSNMVAVMERADLAVTAGGIAMFELCCVGTPSVVVCAERFEEETAARLDREGAVVNLGFGGTLDFGKVPSTLTALTADVGRRRAMGSRGRVLVDGRGAERVASLIRSRLGAARVVRS